MELKIELFVCGGIDVIVVFGYICSRNWNTVTKKAEMENFSILFECLIIYTISFHLFMMPNRENYPWLKCSWFFITHFVIFCIKKL